MHITAGYQVSVEGVFDQLGVETALRVDGEPHDGETDRPAPARERAVLGRRRQERPALAPVDRVRGRSEERRRPGLDLDHDELAALAAHEVELAAPRREARANDLIAPPAQELGRGTFALAP